MQTGQPAGADLAAAFQPKARPWLFCLLIAPVAVLSNGVVSGALSLLLRQQGVSPARGASIISLLSLPQTIYFLWSPVTDFWVRRRSWIVLASFAASAALVAAFYQRRLASPLAVALIFISACFVQFVVAACGGLMGTLHGEGGRRRASGFYQAGSLAFGGLAVFVLASQSGRFRLQTLGWTAAAMIALPSLAAMAVFEPVAAHGTAFAETLKRIAREFQETFLSRRAIPYLLTILFPMGSGAMIALLPGLAADYGIGSQQVAWMNGMAGALLCAAGALAATLIPLRIRATMAYISVCLLNQAVLLIFWLGPRRPSTYFVGSTLFLFTVGACYAVFTAIVLEFLGKSGKSGSGRYSIINSLGNVPLVYMTFLDGRGYAHWGFRGMTGIDFVAGTLGGLLLLAYFLRYPINRTLLANV